jgi:hypothetical protein
MTGRYGGGNYGKAGFGCRSVNDDFFGCHGSVMVDIGAGEVIKITDRVKRIAGIGGDAVIMRRII